MLMLIMLTYVFITKHLYQNEKTFEMKFSRKNNINNVPVPFLFNFTCK